MMIRDPRELVVKTAKILDRLGIPYAITGGFAVLVWGRPRFTADIDMIIELIVPKVKGLLEAFRGLSPHGYIDEQMILDAIRLRSEFNFIDPDSGFKIDFFVVKNDAYSKMKLQRRLKKTIGDQEVFFVSPEDLILSKLLWAKASGSEKQMSDVQSVVVMMSDELDWKYLDEWANSLGLDVPRLRE